MNSKGDYMGDGRYYTYFQFADVILSTFLAIGSIVSIIFFHYRKSKDRSIAYLTTLSLLIFAVSVLRIIESVSPNLEIASRLRELQLVFLVAAVILGVLNKNYIGKKLWAIVIVTLVLGFTNMFLDVLFITYEFHNIQYTNWYKGFLLILIIALCSYVVLKRNDGLSKYKFMLLLLPLGVYLFITSINNNAVCYLELALSFGVLIYANLRFTSNSESSYSILAFDKIGNISTNYLFVIDKQGKVIYSNDMVKVSEFFGEIKHIESITNIFKGGMVKSYAYLTKDYVNIKKDGEDFYFTYSYSKLYNNKETIGSIITITNITDLILLLNDLEHKKAESKKLNDELKNYSKVVYHLEKEREINNLLEEIVRARDEQMNSLTNLIKDTKTRIDDETFESYIEQSIDKSNEILEDVRKTVTQNRAYYGG